MKLADLSKHLLVCRTAGEPLREVTGLSSDSRRVRPGDLFFCLRGLTRDGHDFAGDAVAKGAAALVVERELPLPVPQLIVPDAQRALAQLADAYFGRPSRLLRPIGVTGTNGKTTTTWLIERILLDAGVPTGVIGTVEIRYAGKSVPASITTPDVLELQRLFREMADAGVRRCVMEVSSHALEQGRVRGLRFRTAVFTNLTQDHLDYHGTMEAYASAKGLLFARLGNAYEDDPAERTYAVLNADDPASEGFARLTSAEVVTYGIERDALVRAVDVKATASGASFTAETFAGTRRIHLRLVGKFNVYNALAALAAALCEGIPLEAAAASLERVTGVPGRLEPVDEGQPFAVVVDYAHTPDGLDNVLRAVREIAEKRVICVFGCGGDRDRTKRPVMGRIAAQLADFVWVTSDNPRSEDPAAILRDIEAGLIESGCPADRYAMEVDRRTAIFRAVEMAKPGDVVLIAGKGHETYQIIGGDTLPFDDRLAASEAIRSRMP
jgi:UDP-N-acetylmuramoyl-L-alanyl-D-glutamate--2,6-diaminopimelate ligase